MNDLSKVLIGIQFTIAENSMKTMEVEYKPYTARPVYRLMEVVYKPYTARPVYRLMEVVYKPYTARPVYRLIVDEDRSTGVWLIKLIINCHDNE